MRYKRNRKQTNKNHKTIKDDINNIRNRGVLSQVLKSLKPDYNVFLCDSYKINYGIIYDEKTNVILSLIYRDDFFGFTITSEHVRSDSCGNGIHLYGFAFEENPYDYPETFVNSIDKNIICDSINKAMAIYNEKPCKRYADLKDFFNNSELKNYKFKKL